MSDIDGNTYAINLHLAEREEYDAWQEGRDAIEALADAQERIEELEIRINKAEIIVGIIASEEWEERLGEAVDLSCEYLAELMEDYDE